MTETWLLVDADVRRRNWWISGIVAVLFMVIASLALIPTQEDPHPSAEFASWWGGIFGGLGLSIVVGFLSRTYGRTLVTADGMHFYTFFSRRTVPWSNVRHIERRIHPYGRGNPWWDLRVHRVLGRTLSIPGTYTNFRNDESLNRKLRALRGHVRRL